LIYEPPSGCPVPNLDKVIAWLVYSSMVLGVFFLAVLHGIPDFPNWLFYSIMGGEVLWILCAVVMRRGAKWAPYLAVVLALITLAVSLPQPTHYTFASSGDVVAFMIFSIGSIIQVGLIASVALWFLRARKR
jgi:hypothetical protein